MSRTDKDRKRKHLPEHEQPRSYRGGGDWRGIGDFVNVLWTRPDRRRAKRACQLHTELVEQHRHRGRWWYY